MSDDPTIDQLKAMFQPRDAIAFLRLLRPSGPWTLTALYNDAEPGMRERTVWARTVNEAREFIVEHRTANLYYQCNPTDAVASKAALTDIKRHEYCFADVDSDEEGLRIRSWDIEAKERIACRLLASDKPGEPTFLVDSGNGIQALWMLRDALEVQQSSGTMEMARQMNYGTVLAHGGDRGVFSPAHLLRLPGTINWPDAKKRLKGFKVCPTRLLKHNEVSYSFGAFQLAVPPKKDTSGVDVQLDAVQLTLKELQEDYGLPGWLLSLIDYGHDDKSTDRSEPLFKVVCGMVRRKVPDDVIKGVILNPDFGMSESVLDHEQRSPSAYADRQIRRAHDAVDDEDPPAPPLDAYWLEEEDDAANAQCADADAPKREKRRRWQRHKVSDLTNLPPTDWLIEKILPVRGLLQIFGPMKEFKTFVALFMALCIAMGRPFHGLKVRRAKVLYVLGEGQYEAGPRVRAWCLQNGVDEKELDEWFTFVLDAVALDELDSDGELDKFLQERKLDGMEYGAIFYDTLNKNMHGDESNTKEMGVVVRGLEHTRRVTRAAQIVIHHTGWDRTRARGSTVLLGAVDASFKVYKAGGIKSTDCRLIAEHVKAGPAGWGMRFDMVKVVLATEPEEQSTLVMELRGECEAEEPKRNGKREPVVKEKPTLKPSAAERVLMDIAVLPDSVSISDAAKMLGMDRGNLSKYAKQLIENGLVAKEDGKIGATVKGLELAQKLSNNQST